MASPEGGLVSGGDIAALIVSIALFLYLCYALFRAERF
jgi:K+-transporting ATPase KdpF subunit